MIIEAFENGSSLLYVLTWNFLYTYSMYMLISVRMICIISIFKC